MSEKIKLSFGQWLVVAPMFMLSVAITVVLALGVKFWEAWVAIQVWNWFVPQELPTWALNWWTLGWANVTVSLMLRQIRWRSQEEKDANGQEHLQRLVEWGYLAPAAILLTSWVIKEWFV